MLILSELFGAVIFQPLRVMILVAKLWGFITLPLLGLLSWRQLAMLPPLWCPTQQCYVILTLDGLAPASFVILTFGDFSWPNWNAGTFQRQWLPPWLIPGSQLWQKQMSRGQLWTNIINNFFSQFWLILWPVLDESLSQSKVMGILKRPLCLMATMRSG